MILARRCGLLILSLTIAGCGRNPSSGSTPVIPPAAIRASTDQQSPSDAAELTIEQVSDSRPVDPFAVPEAQAVVLIFVSTACPIANRYAPELSRLFAEYQAKNVSFWLVYADSDESLETIRRHLAEYRHQIPALRDPEHRLVKFCAARRTPEAAVFTPDRRRQYLGRIDDRFTDYGKSREFASQHDLQDALDAVLAGKSPTNPTTLAIGCEIPGVAE